MQQCMHSLLGQTMTTTPCRRGHNPNKHGTAKRQVPRTVMQSCIQTVHMPETPAGLKNDATGSVCAAPHVGCQQPSNIARVLAIPYCQCWPDAVDNYSLPYGNCTTCPDMHACWLFLHNSHHCKIHNNRKHQALHQKSPTEIALSHYAAAHAPSNFGRAFWWILTWVG